MTITHITDREAALERENARLLQTVRIQAITIEAQGDEIARLKVWDVVREAIIDDYIDQMAALKAQPAQPTSADYAMGYAEGFNDGCKPVPIRARLFEIANALPGCHCAACDPPTWGRSRMVLCAVCGNKRCPHATNHTNHCTESNEPGQLGSSYEGVKQ